MNANSANGEPGAGVQTADERPRRWRLILGGGEADGVCHSLSVTDAKMDSALEALYDSQRKAGLGSSAPHAVRWLGDIRAYFPSSVVQVMQRDAFERLGLKQMLLEPEMLASVEPDVHLVATLLSLRSVIPARTRDTARQVVGKVVADLEKRLASPLRQAITGALHRSVRNRRPRHREIDWNRTVRANLKHYQPELKTIIPERRIGFGRKGQALREVVLCIDQSGSMAGSVVYAGILGAVMASLKSIRTSLVVFDTSVVDLTERLSDPVELLFSTQLGGGTDIAQALTYSQGLVRAPHEAIFVLISDLYEGGNEEECIRRFTALTNAGVQVIALLALDDRGAPIFDHGMASRVAGLGIPCFACTPDTFPDLMAAAIKRQDIGQWAAARGIVTARGAG